MLGPDRAGGSSRSADERNERLAGAAERDERHVRPKVVVARGVRDGA